VLVDGRWVGLEGVILDHSYLDGLRSRVQSTGAMIGYGVGTDDIADPPITWEGNDTAIQATGVNQDFGVYDDPDSFYSEHSPNLSGLKAWVFQHVLRHRMNRIVNSIRSHGGSPAACCSPGAPALTST
jgi:hypothetical protein